MSQLSEVWEGVWKYGRRGGLMVSALDSGVSAPGLSPGQGHCVVFWARHFTFTVPLSTQVYKWGNPAMDWHPIQGGVEKTQSLHATETGISSGLMGHLARNADFTYLLPFEVWVNLAK